MLINGRDYVMQLAEQPATLSKELESLPSQMGADDITDMCDLAEHYSMVTPQSFRADYASKVFGSGSRRVSTTLDMFGTMCLSVPVETILRHSEGQIKFFVIDTRPLMQYDAAHLSYAWHLDASLMMDQPKIFAEELARVEDALISSMQHPCFLHTGLDDDMGQLGMVVSQFLQRHHKYVSVVKGGFAALEKRLESLGAGGSKYLVRQSLPLGRGPPTGDRHTDQPSPDGQEANEDSAWGSRLASWKAVAKDAYRNGTTKIAEKSVQAKLAAKETSKQLVQKYEELKAKTKMDPKAQYRGKDRSLRSELEDEEYHESEMRAAEMELEEALVARMSSPGKLVCSIAKLSKLESVSYVFKCSEIDNEGFLFPSQLVLTKTHVLKFRDRTPRESELLERRHLVAIARITAKKKHPNLITLVYELDAKTVLPPAETVRVGGGATTGVNGGVGGADGGAVTALTSEAKSEPVFSIGDVGDDDMDRSVGSTEPSDAVTRVSPASNHPDSSVVSESSRVTPQPQDEATKGSSIVEVREMFMVPEATEAKVAFRVLIMALQAEDSGETVNI